LPLDRAEALLMALQEHFNTEERLAFAVGHDFAEHALKHEKMMAVIRNGIAKVNAGTKDVFGLLRYVEYWFERHIAEEDKALGVKLLASVSLCGAKNN
jgi:hemerythrin